MRARLSIRCSSIAVFGLCACGPEATTTSPCYAPAPYTYKGEVRQLAPLPRTISDALALPNGRVLALGVEIPDSGTVQFLNSAHRFDPNTGALDAIGEWEGSPGPAARLADGRVIAFTGFDCRYVLFDPDRPGSLASRTCALGSPDDNLNVELIWQAPGGEVLLFGPFFPGGNLGGATVFELDVASGAIVKYDTSAEHNFARPPDAPFPLCDGRIVFPHTELDGGDFIDDAPAVHYYDPEQRRLSTLDLPFAPDFAAQLDATTALLLGHNFDGPQAAVLDLETRALTPVSAPETVFAGYDARERMIGLADGSALVIGDDGDLHVFDAERREFTKSARKFAEAPRALVRLTTGPVLAFGDDGVVEIYE